MGELRYAILKAALRNPPIAVRGPYTKLSGISQLSLDTKSLDISISKGFAMFTPYAGIGQVWVNSQRTSLGLAAEKNHPGQSIRRRQPEPRRHQSGCRN